MLGRMNTTRGTTRICSLNVNGTMVSGTGATEEEARENVLKKVKEMLNHSPVIPSGEMLATTINSGYFGTGRPTNANMVGKLQEMCVAKHWPLPVYHLLDSQGPSHMPHFLMTCSVKDYVAVGNGRTKKEAKHNAAQKLLDMIRPNGSEDRGPVPVVRVPPLCAPPPPLVSCDVGIVYMERRRFQSPSLEATNSFKGYHESTPLRNRPLLSIKGREERERSLSPERAPPSVSEVKNISEEPIPLPSVEDYLCGRFQDKFKINEW